MGDPLNQFLRSVPPIAWVLGLFGLVMLGRFLHVRAAVREGRAGPDGATVLAELHAALQRFAAANGGVLPATLAEIEFWRAGDVTYRPVEGRAVDEKCLIAHDARGETPVAEFLTLRRGRHVLFWSGRVRLVSESAFERLIEADDAFRERSKRDD